MWVAALLRVHRHHRKHVLLSSATIALPSAAVGLFALFLNALWLRPTPVFEPERVVVPLHADVGRDPSRFGMKALESFREFGLFEGVAGQAVTATVGGDLQANVRIAQVGRLVETRGVTDSYFQVLGVPVLGREFAAADNQPGAAPVAIISDRLWREAFGRAGWVIGAVVPATPTPVQIVGVAAQGFNGALRGERVDLWLPAAILPALVSSQAQSGQQISMPMMAVCRLRSGLSVTDASAMFQQRMGPRGLLAGSLTLEPLSNLFGAADLPTVAVGGDAIAYVVLGGAGALTLIGLVTLVALLSLHFERRRVEFTVRRALGARSRDLLVQIGQELVVVTVIGIGAGLLLAQWISGLVPVFRLPNGVDLSRLDVTMDGAVVALVASVGVLVAVGGAALPAFRVWRQGATPATLAGTAQWRHGISQRQVVLMTHVALTVVALVVTALFVESLRRGLTEGPGFDAEKALFVDVRIRSFRGWTEQALDEQSTRDAAAVAPLLDRIRQLPGVERVAVGGSPLGPDVVAHMSSTQVVESDDRAIDIPVGLLPVGPGYLEAIGANVASKNADLAGAAVVSASLANALWPDQSAVGQRVRWQTVHAQVGAVVDMAFGSVRLGRPAMILVNALPPRQLTDTLQFVVRTSAPEDVAPLVERAVTSVFPSPLSVRITAGRQVVESDLGRERLAAWFLSIAGSVIWALGVLSVFGVVAYVIEARWRDFGVMMALGAGTRQIGRIALAAGLLPTIAGGVIGLALAAAAAELIQSFLLGVSATHAATFFGVFVFFVACAVVAATMATLRLRRSTPLDAIRAE